MSLNIFIPIITAIIGFFAGTVPSYINFRLKKMELEYFYNKSKEERLFDNSRKYIDTLYKPINQILITLEHNILDNDLKHKDTNYSITMATMEIIKIRDCDDIIFLNQNIELELSQLYRFLMNSLNNKNYTFGIKTSYRLFGIEIVSYNNETYNDEKSALKSVKKKRLINSMVNLSYSSSYIFSIKYEVISKSADIASVIFKKQLNKHITTIKSELKQIVLGD